MNLQKVFEIVCTIFVVILLIYVGILVVDKVTSEAKQCDSLYGIGNWTYKSWNGTGWQEGWIENAEMRCVYNGTTPLTLI